MRRIILKILLKQKMYIKMKLKKMEKYFLNQIKKYQKIMILMHLLIIE